MAKNVSINNCSTIVEINSSDSRYNPDKITTRPSFQRNSSMIQHKLKTRTLSACKIKEINRKILIFLILIPSYLLIGGILFTHFEHDYKQKMCIQHDIQATKILLDFAEMFNSTACSVTNTTALEHAVKETIHSELLYRLSLSSSYFWRLLT